MIAHALRRALARLGRNRTFPRRLPPHLGGLRFFASTEGGLKFLKPKFWNAEPDLCCFVQRYVAPGAVVWDVGANVGLFSFMSAGLAGPAGHVLAIEADAWLCEVLRRSTRRLPPHAAAIDILPCAVSDEVGLTTLRIAHTARATSHLATVNGYGTTGGVRFEHTVPSLTLDTILDRRIPPSIVKIDVEGMELAVLEGARRVLSEVRPTFMLEVGFRAEELTHMLRTHDYRLLNGSSGRETKTATWSTIALPN